MEIKMKFEKYWMNLESEVNKRGGDGKALAEALSDLCSIYEKGLYIWLAKLYCPEVGGFYYSNSGRDNEGFLPDLESTLQATGIISRSGLIESKKLLPEKMKEQIRGFLLDCFDPEDGYFYHKQWGKNIIDARRGRDLMWSESMCADFGVKLPAPTATERLRASAAASSADRGVVLENLPDYLRSKEAFLEYLKSWDFVGNSYVAGNNLVAQSQQIVAAGYAPVAIEYLNSIQNPETGFWGDKSGYDAVNGFLKITSFYVDAKAPVNYAYKAAMSTIDCLTIPDSPPHVCCQYNVWFSLGNLLDLFDSLSDVMDKDEADKIKVAVLNRAPEAIAATKEKLLVFKKTDGSFSYTPMASSWVSQNAHVAVKGTNEGDVNATCICSVEILHKIYRALRLLDFIVPLYDEEDYKEFLNNLRI